MFCIGKFVYNSCRLGIIKIGLGLERLKGADQFILYPLEIVAQSAPKESAG
jgi:hypothetical protein